MAVSFSTRSSWFSRTARFSLEKRLPCKVFMLNCCSFSRIFLELSLPCSAGMVFSMFFLLDLRLEAAGSRERLVWASQSRCFVRFSCKDVVLARGFCLKYRPRARRESFFSIFLVALILATAFSQENPRQGFNQKNVEKKLKPENLNLLGHN